MTRASLRFAAGLAATAIFAASPATAATSFSNSLTGFTGNSSQLATQTALATAGFNFSTTSNSVEFPPGSASFIDPSVTFNSSGATFGASAFGDGGRNYIRTTQSDYAFGSFTAQITIVTTDIDSQDIYFGLGAGDANNDWYRLADFEANKSSVQYFGESENIGNTENPPTLEVSKTADGEFVSTLTPIPALPSAGTHRIQISLDRFARTFTVGFDLNYAGGAFAADVTTPAMNVSNLYGPTGWQHEPSRIFFGGDDTMVIKDFSVNVTSAVAKDGDFNSDGFVNAADWLIMRANQQANMSADTLQQAFFKGDLTGDKKNNHADFAYFKKLYDFANGEGAFVAMLASIPEPGSATLLGTALAAVAQTRRARGRLR